MHRSTKACSIPAKVKERVYYRDNCRCVLCGSPYGLPEAHFIPRSQLGLGIEENVVTLCRSCHERYDNSADRAAIRDELRQYLSGKYENWSEDALIYRKGE